MLVNILGITDDAKCDEMVRPLRGPDGLRCPPCESAQVVQPGRDDTERARPRYECRGGARRVDDRTGTIVAGPHPPLRVGILVLYLMGLNRCNAPIAQELDRAPEDAPRMTRRLGEGVVRRQPEVQLRGVVECDEVDVGAGHKGPPEVVREQGARAGDAAGKGPPAGGRWRRRRRRSSA